MVTTFNKKDLISFGKYLLSEGREKSLKQTSIENPDALPYEERCRYVYDADFANWLVRIGKTLPPDGIRLPNEKEMQGFIDGLEWSDDFTEREITLVKGNLNGFYNWIKNGMPAGGK